MAFWRLVQKVSDMVRIGDDNDDSWWWTGNSHLQYFPSCRPMRQESPWFVLMGGVY
jgi:hypothetical protein